MPGLDDWLTAARSVEADQLREQILTGFKSGKPFTPCVPTLALSASGRSVARRSDAPLGDLLAEVIVEDDSATHQLRVAGRTTFDHAREISGLEHYEVLLCPRV